MTARLLALVGVSAAQRIVACLGDSITQGSTASDPETTSWPARLGALLGPDYDVQNFGRSGKTVLPTNKEYAASSWYRNALKSGAELAIIGLGTNDAKDTNWVGSDIEERFLDAYRTLINASLATFPQIILSVPIPQLESGWHWPDSSIINTVLPGLVYALASEFGLAVVDSTTSFVDATSADDATVANATLYADVIHPNDLGFSLIAQQVASVVLATEPTTAPTTYAPSYGPSSLPTTALPSSRPTIPPSTRPTSMVPTSLVPTSSPTSTPSADPTSHPTGEPSQQPSSRPTTVPSQHPSTSMPSRQPSPRPTAMPSQHPSTSMPSQQPSPRPTPVPSQQPAPCPTAAPSQHPSSQVPSQQPIPQPTPEATPLPTTPAPASMVGGQGAHGSSTLSSSSNASLGVIVAAVCLTTIALAVVCRRWRCREAKTEDLAECAMTKCDEKPHEVQDLEEAASSLDVEPPRYDFAPAIDAAGDTAQMETRKSPRDGDTRRDAGAPPEWHLDVVDDDNAAPSSS